MEWNGNEKQQFTCKVHSIFKNKRLTEIESHQLQEEIERDEIVPDRVDTVLEMSCGESSGTGTVRKQCCNFQDYNRDTPEDHIENPILQFWLK